MAVMTFTEGNVLYAANLNAAFSTGIANNNWTFTNTISFTNVVTVSSNLVINAESASIRLEANNTFIYFSDGTTQYTAATPKFDIAFNFEDISVANEIIGRFVFPRSANSVTGLTGSVARAGTTSSANSDIRIQKNGTTFGTLRFQAANANGIFVNATAQTFTTGDVLTLVANATPDISLRQLSITLTNFV